MGRMFDLQAFAFRLGQGLVIGYLPFVTENIGQGDWMIDIGRRIVVFTLLVFVLVCRKA